MFTQSYVVWSNVSQQLLGPRRYTRLAKGGRSISLFLIGIAVAMAALWVMPKSAAAQGDIIFTVPDLTVATTDTTVTVPVSFVTPNDVTLTGFRVELTYDATKLAVASCILANTGFCNSNTAGVIIFNGVGFSGIADGTVATIVFTILDSTAGTSAMSMSLSQILDTNLADITARATTDNGSVTIASPIDVDDRMTRGIDYATATFTGPTDPPSPSALLGHYDLDFLFTYSGDGPPLKGVYLRVNTATDTALLNANDGIGEIGSVLTVADTSLPGSDTTFDPNDVLTVPLVVGVNAYGGSLDFDLMGVEQTTTVSSNESRPQEVLLGKFTLTVEELRQISKIYLPVIVAE